MSRDLDELLDSAIKALEDVGSFHFEMEMNISAKSEGIAMEIPFKFEGDFQAPDRSKGKMELSIFFFTVETEFVQIGDTNYSSDPETGEWQIDTEPLSPFGSPIDFAGPESLTSIDDLVLVGEETRDGVKVLHFTGSVPASDFGEEDAEGELRIDLWIGVEDSLLREMSFEGEFDAPEELSAGTGAGTAELSLTLKLSNYGVPVVIEATELSPEAIASATAAASMGPPDADLDCLPYLSLFITSAGDFDLPVVTSYQCFDAFIDSTGQGPPAEPTFSASAGEAIELSFSTGEAPSTVELRLYPSPGVSGSFMKWPEDLPGGPEPVESAILEPDLAVSHAFDSGPGDYSLVVRATWDGPVEVFYAVSLRLE
ncbi:MAG: LppX_LprAFG lipoprotein [Chloroflexi bacterium]|nr:LppX_LprAFG lipoprotein [Chloroflexota bacterium]